MTTKHLLRRANAPAALSLLGVAPGIFHPKEQAAIQQAQALAARLVGAQTAASSPDFAEHQGRALLWHPEFAHGLRLHCCDTPLYRLAVELPAALLVWNGGQPLHWLDYAYIADVLRELLADARTRQERLNLGRALVWVEETGERADRPA